MKRRSYLQRLPLVLQLRWSPLFLAAGTLAMAPACAEQKGRRKASSKKGKKGKDKGKDEAKVRPRDAKAQPAKSGGADSAKTDPKAAAKLAD